jgi:tRNA 2-thiouridine synthesizing protein E
MEATLEAIDVMPELDAEGYLVEPGEWNERVAHELARRIDIDLNDEHWEVLRFMRDYYEDHQVAADARHVIKHLEQRGVGDGRNHLFGLFPYGYVAQACKIAGMKRPRAWSTG